MKPGPQTDSSRAKASRANHMGSVELHLRAVIRGKDRELATVRNALNMASEAYEGAASNAFNDEPDEWCRVAGLASAARSVLVRKPVGRTGSPAYIGTVPGHGHFVFLEKDKRGFYPCADPKCGSRAVCPAFVPPPTEVRT